MIWQFLGTALEPVAPTPGLVQLQGQARATSSRFTFAMVLDEF